MTNGVTAHFALYNKLRNFVCGLLVLSLRNLLSVAHFPVIAGSAKQSICCRRRVRYPARFAMRLPGDAGRSAHAPGT
jgi:hypothetical protein